MARANLNISKQLLDAFQSANDTRSQVRALKVGILNEDIILSSTMSVTNVSAENDFNVKLKGQLSEKDACLILFRLANTADDHSKKWLLISWIPDNSKVRDKMLYSSSREDLKKGLGLALFVTPDYQASTLHDISWDTYIASTTAVASDDILTNKEKSLRDEDALANTERLHLGTKSTAMGVVPFTLSSEVSDILRQFNASNKVNWIEMSVVNEVVKLESSKMLSAKDHLEAHINPAHARFIIARFPNFENKQVTMFIYSCPENIPIRDKMTMSTSKATVISSASIESITIDKTIEIHGPDEIMHAVQSELAAPPDAGLAASERATLTHNKPLRPGKGKTVIKKFQADSEDI